MRSPSIPPSSKASVRGLSETELTHILIDHCAAEVGDIFDKWSVAGVNSARFKEGASADIADLLANMSAPLAAALIAAGTGKTSEEVEAMGSLSRMLTSVGIVHRTFARPEAERFSEKLFHALFAAASKRSAALSGNGQRH